MPDELISAYLDGEVTAQERAQVERLLRSEPRYQQTLDELRTLRETLQSLPRYQLDGDFHRRVLQLAQQQQHDDQNDSSPPTESDSDVTREGAPARGFRRGLLWACIAVAAAILLMVYVPPTTQQAIGPVAQQPPSDGVSVETESLDGIRGVRRGFRQTDANEAPRVREELMRGTSDRALERQPALYERRDAESAETELDLRSQPADTEAMEFDQDEALRSKSATTWNDSRDDDAIAPSIAEDMIADQPAPTSGDSIDRAADQNLGVAIDQNLGSQGGVAATVNGLAADAVIHLRIALQRGNAEQLLTDNLKRNSVELVRQEPVEAGQTVAYRRAGQLAREPVSSLYASNQAAVDYALAPTRPKAEAVQLFFVQAEAPQIVTAVNELQQEGASVLATVPGPRQTQLGLGRDSLHGWGYAGRFLGESGITAAKGLSEDRETTSQFGVASEPSTAKTDELRMRERRLPATPDQSAPNDPSQVAMPSRASRGPREGAAIQQGGAPVEAVERMGELAKPATPALEQQAGQVIAEHAPHAAQNRNETEEDFAYDVDFWNRSSGPSGDTPVQRERSYYSWQAPQSTLEFPLEEATRQQIDNLSTAARGRPLQVLFVLHDEDSPPIASEVPPAASELPAEAPATEATGAVDPPSPE